MSENPEVENFYNENHTIGLVTNASYLNQNLALLNTDDYYKADCLAAAHEGYINYIPLVNTVRRCKYVPICAGCDRGKGIIKWMKWVKMDNDTYFVCLSTIGVQFFDVELTDIQFEYDFKELNSRLSLPLGACILGDVLFVGTAMGMVVMFRSHNESIKMVNSIKLTPFLYLDGFGECLVTVSREELKSYRFENGGFQPVAELRETLFLFSVIKVFKYTLIVGHHNGEVSVISFPCLRLLLKQKIHNGEITAIEYSTNKQILLSSSDDLTIKAWKLNTAQTNMTCIFNLKSADKPFCGLGFTNRSCTEFCVVKANSLVVKFYTEKMDENVENESSDDDFTEPELL